MLEINGSTLICGGNGSGKSTLLTSIVRCVMATDQTCGMMFYGASMSFEKFLLERQNDQRFLFVPVYQAPFNKHSPGVKKLIWAIENIDRAANRILIAIDDASHLFPDKTLAAKFAAAVLESQTCDRHKIDLMMTTDSTDSIAQLFGEKFLYEFENHILLKNRRQSFYESVIETETIEDGIAMPIIKGVKSSKLKVEFESTETVRQKSAARDVPAGIFERIFS